MSPGNETRDAVSRPRQVPFASWHDTPQRSTLTGMTLILRPVRLDDEAQMMAAHAVMRADDFVFALGHREGMSFADYVTKLDDARAGRGVPAGWVASTFLVAEVGGVIVGRLSLRHDLTDFLRRIGGHIGFGVLPEHRGHGYATTALRQALRLAAGLSLRKVLLTCDEPNLASRRIIEKCGGVYADTYHGPEVQVAVRQYWASTDAGQAG